ncbi:MAG: AAA family ATPase, partial [bacterium]|nr:AAA family ATPase [bacterium]
ATSELKAAEQTQAKATAIQNRGTLGSLPIAVAPESLERVLKSTLDTAAMAAEEKIREHLAATSQGLTISWIKQGHEAQTGSLCPHCGQDMQGLEILDVYRSFFSGELQEQERLQESVLASARASFGESAQNQLQQILTAHNTEQVWWKDAAGYSFSLPHLSEHESILTAMQRAYQALSEALDRKKTNPGTSVDIDSDEESAISAWQGMASELEVYNKDLSKINKEIDEFKALSGTIELTSF